MNKKWHCLLLSIGYLIPILEEKRNISPEIFSIKPNAIINFFKYNLETIISRFNKLKEYREIKKCYNSKAYFQKITNSSDHLFNEIRLNLNHQNMVSQPT
jgi:hypothetical protein